MKNAIEKPKHPGKYKEFGGFPLRNKGKWNPLKPVSAVDNLMPQSMWPFKRGTAVFAIDTRFQIPVSGHVSFYNPAREIDRSCITTPGYPFFNVRNRHGSTIMNTDEVFPYTKRGWFYCLKKLAKNYEAQAASQMVAGQCVIKNAHKLREFSQEIMNQAKGKKHVQKC